MIIVIFIGTRSKSSVAVIYLLYFLSFLDAGCWREKASQLLDLTFQHCARQLVIVLTDNASITAGHNLQRQQNRTPQRPTAGFTPNPTPVRNSFQALYDEDEENEREGKGEVYRTPPSFDEDVEKRSNRRQLWILYSINIKSSSIEKTGTRSIERTDRTESCKNTTTASRTTSNEWGTQTSL